MKYQGSLYVCERKEVTIAFYKEVMGLRVISDFGTNFTFTGGISFQTKDSWATFIEKKAEDVSYGGNDAEIYFEEDDLESLMKRLNTYAELEMIHPIKEHDWGQRGLRFYDPDKHIIEVSESLACMCKRMQQQGMTAMDIAEKSGLSEKMVLRFLKA